MQKNLKGVFTLLGEKTLAKIHDEYNNTVKCRYVHTNVDIQEELLKRLKTHSPEAEDLQDFDMFLKNLEISIATRKKTFELTNLATDIVFSLCMIAIWANEKKDQDIDAIISARRKSLESENVKYLDKCSLDIHDRFGIRIIILNDESEEKCISILKSFFNYGLSILSGSEVNTDRQAFSKWLSSTTAKKLAGPYIQRVSRVISLPLKSWRIKDYIDTPKENNYQSLQYILTVDLMSKILPGAEFEIQFRTYKMHINAEHGLASHDEYKKRIERLHEIFTIEDTSNTSITGFFGYNSPKDDLDGLHFGKEFVSRRVSKKLIPFK